MKFKFEDKSIFNKYTAKMFLFTVVVTTLMFLSTILGIWVEETNGNYIAGYMDGQVDAINGEINVAIDTSETASIKKKVKKKRIASYIFFAPTREIK